MSALLEHHPHNPLRPPDWRWRRARQLRETRRFTRTGLDDEDVKTVKQFQAVQARCRQAPDYYQLARRWPGLYWADHLRHQQQAGARWAIEARLLAHEPFEDIAAKCACTPETAIWYEKAFFNVLPRLHCTDYIANVVMGPSAHYGLRERDYDLLWKLLGYGCGAKVLDAVILPITRCPVTDATPEAMTDGYRGLIRGELGRKAAFAAMTIPVAYNHGIILDLWTKLTEVEKNTDGGGTNGTNYAQNIYVALTSLQFTVGRPAVAEAALEHYDDQGAELRAHELLLTACGKEPAGLKDEIAAAGAAGKEGKDGGQAHQQGS